MRKIPTIFIRNVEGKVVDQWNYEAEWVRLGKGRATEKVDGTNVRVTVRAGEVVRLEKRRNPTQHQKQKGIEPWYTDAHQDDPNDKWIWAAVAHTKIIDDRNLYENPLYLAGEIILPDGEWSCEAIGPGINNNPYRLANNVLYPFSFAPIYLDAPREYDLLKRYFPHDSVLAPRCRMEGIVWHGQDGRMAKIKARDF